MRFTGGPVLRAYLDDLLRPTEFRGYAATVNQLGHVVLGSALCWLAGLFVPYPIAVIVVGYALFETWQGGTMRDAVVDTAFVALGALAASWVAVVSILLAGVFGILTVRDESQS